ncbi:MAG: DUF2155 domain-containing protein [Pseudomonadota bacterium]
MIRLGALKHGFVAFGFAFIGIPLAEAQDPTFTQYDTVTLRALDKITARSTDFEMQVGTPMVYGSLRIDVDVCFQRPPEEPPESAAFLRITSATSRAVESMAVPRSITAEERAATETEAPDVRFSGWMFASSPGLNALEHPVYDIWVIACTTEAPVIPPAPLATDVGE